MAAAAATAAAAVRCECCSWRRRRCRRCCCCCRCFCCSRHRLFLFRSIPLSLSLSLARTHTLALTGLRRVALVSAKRMLESCVHWMAAVASQLNSRNCSDHPSSQTAQHSGRATATALCVLRCCVLLIRIDCGALYVLLCCAVRFQQRQRYDCAESSHSSNRAAASASQSSAHSFIRCACNEQIFVCASAR